MYRSKQTVLNVVVAVALLLSLIGVGPVGAIQVEPSAPAAPAARPAAAATKPAFVGQVTRDGFNGGQSTSRPLQAANVEEDEYAALGDAEVLIIVRLSDPDVVNYAGGIHGLAPTAPEETGAKQFDANTPASKAYMNYLAQKQAAFVAAVREISPDAKAVANYQAAMNGVALRLPASAVAKVRALPGVTAIYKSEIQHIDTDRGPQWIGAPSVWAALGGQDVSGEGVVIGVIDTGIWSPNPLTPTLQYTMTHPSFESGPSAYGGAYTFPFTSVTGINYSQKLGVCAPVPTQSSDGTFVCNDKIIGAYWYNAVNIATATEFKSPLDNGGHGTHTASTAGGNRTTATVSGSPIVSGVAPRARIIAYKVCWEGDPNNSADGGCGNVDSLSAINQAILDGVNVINFSISGGNNPFGDPVELGFLNARAAGIFVSASAGNSGPTAGTVAHLGPWTNTSAAMQHDRTVLADVVVTSTFGTPPTGLRGASATGGFTGKAVLAPSQFAGDTYPGQCTQPFAPGTFQSTDVVVCRRGINARIEKSRNVMMGGAGGFILVNAANNQGLSLDAHWIPGVHLERNATALSTAGENLVTYLLTAVPTNVVTITLSGGYPFTRTGDVMASFSSRGPSANNWNQIKPDNAAPGVEILAGVTPQNSENWTPDGNLYEYYNGTSMSSPHTAGAGALLKALHPDWTPSEIQAALMTGAVPILKEDAATAATPFDQGAGRINLTHSMDPGLLFNVPTADYQAFISGTKTLESLNIPSFAQRNCLLSCSWMRTAENALTTTATYTWTVVSATPNFTVTLDQASYTFGPGETKNFTVTANVSALPDNGEFVFARVILHETTTGQEVQMPVAVIKVGSVFDSPLNINTHRNSGDRTFNGLAGNNYSGVTTTLYGLADPQVRRGFAKGGDDQDAATHPLDPAYGWDLYTDTLPSGLGRYIVTTGNSTASDIDLYILYDFGGDGYDFADGDPANPNSDVIAASTSGTANEMIELLDLQAWAGEKFLIAVYNWSGETDAHYDLTRWHVVKPTGSLAVSGVPTTLTAGDAITPVLTYNKFMEEGKKYYGLLNIGTAGDETAVTQIPINVSRITSEVGKSVSPTVAKAGQTVTYTIVVQNFDPVARTFNITDVLPAGVTYISGTLTGPATYDSGTNAVLISTTLPGLIQSPTYYVVEDSLTKPSIIAESPTGGFDDFRQYGAPGPRGDNLAFAFNSIGCAMLSFYGDPTVSGTNADALGYNTNGGFFPRSSTSSAVLSAGPHTAPLPTAALPNGFIAGFGGDLSITNTVNITDAGRIAVSGGNCVAGTYLFGLQLSSLHKKSDDSQKLDVQYIYDQSQPGVHWVQFGNVSPSFNTSGGISGAENFAGTEATAYTGPITSGLVLKFYHPAGVPASVTVTFKATVNGGTAPTIVNTAHYTVTAPNTTLMDVLAVLERFLYKLYGPVVRS